MYVQYLLCRAARSQNAGRGPGSCIPAQNGQIMEVHLGDTALQQPRIYTDPNWASEGV